MTRPRIRLQRATWLAALAVATLTQSASAQPSPEQQSAIRANCRSDFMSKCSGVTPGGKDALMCLQKNVASLSPGCKTAVSATLPAPAPAEAKPAQAAPAPAAAPVAAPPAPASAPPAILIAPQPAPKAPQPEKAATPVKKPAAPAPKQAVAVPAPAAVTPPAAEPPVPMAKIEALSLPTRARIARNCRADEQAVCSPVKRGGGRLIACLAAHKPALSANCRQTLEAALK